MWRDKRRVFGGEYGLAIKSVRGVVRLYFGRKGYCSMTINGGLFVVFEEELIAMSVQLIRACIEERFSANRTEDQLLRWQRLSASSIIFPRRQRLCSKG